MKNSGFMDVQKQFKPWYNQVFPLQQQCQQRLDYDYTDGPLCSCSYRPCKSSIDRWTLTSAIAYTFHEFLHESCVDVTRCLAITKLALVIDEKWTREQVNDYVGQRKAAYEVKRFQFFNECDDILFPFLLGRMGSPILVNIPKEQSHELDKRKHVFTFLLIVLREIPY